MTTNSTINDKLCRICDELKDPRLFPPQSRVCYECKAQRERERIAIRARDDFNRLMCFSPPNLAASLSTNLKSLKKG